MADTPTKPSLIDRPCDLPGCDAPATRGGSTGDGSRYLWTCSREHAE